MRTHSSLVAHFPEEFKAERIDTRSKYGKEIARELKSISKLIAEDDINRGDPIKSYVIEPEDFDALIKRLEGK